MGIKLMKPKIDFAFKEIMRTQGTHYTAIK